MCAEEPDTCLRRCGGTTWASSRSCWTRAPTRTLRMESPAGEHRALKLRSKGVLSERRYHGS